LVFVLGWHTLHPYTIPFATFLGSLITLLAVYWIAKRSGDGQTMSLILTGIALSTLLLAIQGTITYALRDQWQLIQTITEWEAGTTTDRGWIHVHMQLPLTIVGLFISFFYREELDLLAFGDEEAKNLGMEAPRVRWHLFLAVALLSAGSIATVGIIGFFGLILPHVIRQLIGPSNKTLIPLSIFGGAATLLSLDFLLRITKLEMISIGNISAIFGGLFFLSLLLRGKRKGYNA
jgi:iron complex transport system permease protein